MNSELRTRSFTGLAIVAVIIGVTMAGQLPAQIFILAICAFSSYELISMSVPNTGILSKIVFVIFTILPVVWIIAQTQLLDTSLTLLPAFFNMWALPLLLALYVFVIITAGASAPFTHIASMALSILLFSGGGIFAIDIINISPIIILGVFILLWSNDVFAYLIGSRFGKTKLAATISPRKTWEGFIGGGISSIATGALLSMWMTQLNLFDWVIISVMVVVFGTMGDLLQSAIKRHYKVKDSGNLLPGHGGIWDRFDSFVGCVPFISVYLVQTIA
jgi:phosphatidate cytidylyltransferase